jgi:hypothetical protein
MVGFRRPAVDQKPGSPSPPALSAPARVGTAHSQDCSERAALPMWASVRELAQTVSQGVQELQAEVIQVARAAWLRALQAGGLGFAAPAQRICYGSRSLPPDRRT